MLRVRRVMAATMLAVVLLAPLPVRAQSVPVPLTPPRAAPIPCAGGCGDTVRVTYLGAGGFLVRHGADAVMTGPLFSNPGMLRVGAGLPIRADTAEIDRRMRALVPDTAGVAAILVGHSHYDHLMDVPYVARRYLHGARIYGNDAMLNLLAPDTALRGRLRSVRADAGDAWREGRWIYPKAEAPGATGIARDQRQPRGSLPRNAWEWAAGDAYAFVVDFLDPRTGRVLFRFHVADTPASWPDGFAPPSLRGFDAALLCVGSYDTVRDYASNPRGFLTALRPRHAVLGHWEDFFRRAGAAPEPLPGYDLREYLRRVRAALPGPNVATLPAPGDAVRVCACES